MCSGHPLQKLECNWHERTNKRLHARTCERTKRGRVRAFVRSCVRGFVRSCIRSFVRFFVRLFPRMARMGTKLEQNAFQTICNFSFFDAENLFGFGFLESDDFLIKVIFFGGAMNFVFLLADAS